MKNFSFCFLFLVFSFSLFAQENKEILSIDGNPIYQNEFERLFSKNANLINPDKKGSFEDDLNLFIDFNLKVLEAENQGLDSLSGFKKQYNAYKNHLANSYLFNTAVNQKLLEEAYERLKYKRKVKYILVRLEKDAAPKDTLKAYNKAKEFKNKLEKGGDFEKLALEYSEDPSVKENKGNLGWIGVFKSVYEFENAVYQTEIGEISAPFRSQFGYHVIQVVEERKAEGQVFVAHLLIKSTEEEKEAEEKIQNIYEKIKEGANFADMVKQYSDDEASAKNGGKLNPFRRGSLKDQNFEDQAFSLTKENPLSKPFKTEAGWHLLYLLNHTPIGDFEKEKNQLEENIKKNHRSQIVKDSLAKKITDKYAVKNSKSGLTYFKDKIGENFVEDAEKNLPEEDLFSIEEKGYTYEEFLKKIKFLEKFQRKKITADLLQQTYDEVKTNFLINYERENLLQNNKKLNEELGDYKNGLLVYEVINKNVFEKSQDTTALKEFYLANKSSFTTPEKYEVIVVSADRKKEVSKAKKFLRKGKSIEEIKDISDKIIVHSGEFEENNLQLPKNFKKKAGISSIIKQNGVYLVSKTLRVIPSEIKDFEDIKGVVINKYQEDLEKQFIKDLRKKYKVELNEENLKSLKN